MELAHLVYVSSACYDMSDKDLLEILDTARNFNKDREITGLLLYRDGFFIQVLEGDYETIGWLFERISEDKRHTGALKLYHELIDKRKYGKWAMGFVSPDFMKLKEVEGFSDFMEAENISLSREASKKVKDYIEYVLEQFRQPVAPE